MTKFFFSLVHPEFVTSKRQQLLLLVMLVYQSDETSICMAHSLAKQEFL